MRRLLLGLITLAAGCKGCEQTPTPPPASVEAAAPAAKDRAAFVVRRVHEQQKPSKAAPWHEPGGLWTFIDAELPSGARFGFGIDEGPEKSLGLLKPQLHSRSADVILTVPDSAEGAKVIDELAKIFAAKVPPSPWKQPLELSGQSAHVELSKRAPDSGLLDGGHDSVRVALGFTNTGSLSSDFTVSYDLLTKRGELRLQGKGDDVMGYLAGVLRDGPRPPRTPETDPSVSAIGPKIDMAAGKAFAAPKSELLAFRSNNTRVIYYLSEDSGGLRMFEAPVEDPTKGYEILHTERSYRLIDCSPTSEACVIVEAEKPSVIHFIDRAKRTSKKLVGPWGTNAEAASASLSPDGAWVALVAAVRDGGDQQLFIAPTAGGAPVVVAEADGADRWLGTGPALRLIAQQREGGVLAIDPRTGARSPLEAGPPEPDDKLAPDGKHRFECTEKELTVIDVGSGAKRTFAIFPEDQGRAGVTCGKWVGSQYIDTSYNRQALLAIDTMKLSYFFPPKEEHPSELSSDLRWAVTHTDTGLLLSPVVIR